MTTIGSLFSGYSGLDMAVEAVTGGQTVWRSDIDPGANKIIAHHWPDLPNLGDISTVDWSAVEPVDILTGGYPCQPFSMAGRRAGVDDERHLWPFVADALSTLRPTWCFFENVRGHLTLGFDEVLRDLSLLRYDVTWTLIRASDIGAPHGRARVFILGRNHGRRLCGGLDRWRGIHRDRQSGGVLPAAGKGPDDRQGPARLGADAPTLRGNGAHSTSNRSDSTIDRHMETQWPVGAGVPNEDSPIPRGEGGASDHSSTTWRPDGFQPSPKRDDAMDGRDDSPSGGPARPNPRGEPSRARPGAAPWSPGGDSPVGRVVAAGRGPVWSRYVLRELPDERADDCRTDLSAASVGAPHGRFRVFIVAWPTADAAGAERRGPESEDMGASVGSAAEPRERVGAAADTDEIGRDGWPGEFGSGRRGQPAYGSDLPAHADGTRLAQWAGVTVDDEPQRASAQRGHRDGCAAANPTGDGRHEGRSESAGIVRGHDAAERGGAVAPDADRAGIEALSGRPWPGDSGRSQPMVGGGTNWGQFEPAIRRWERLTRPAPAPTETSARGGQRLSPAFVEWMQGLPEGHVTGVPGLTRNEQLKALGNGVVPQQAEAALRVLLGAMAVTA